VQQQRQQQQHKQEHGEQQQQHLRFDFGSGRGRSQVHSGPDFLSHREEAYGSDRQAGGGGGAKQFHRVSHLSPSKESRERDRARQLGGARGRGSFNIISGERSASAGASACFSLCL
jgi:hypothetical protein